ncbi:polyamine aminopropyltransferase [bacterium]|nr:polyamine aminopropyltransferase [bacterium]
MDATRNTDGGRVSPLSGADPKVRALLAATLVVATCGLIYELVAGAMASYLLGDSITNFSLVIGVYLSAMGLGSYASRLLRQERLLERFIQVEIAVGLLGGFSATILFATFAWLDAVRPVLFVLVTLVGVLVGLEVPILLASLKDEVAWKDLVARVLAFDYMGALAASLLFPLVLVPKLGLVRTAFAFGLANALVAFALAWSFGREVRRGALLRAEAFLAALVLASGLALGQHVEGALERELFEAPIIFAKQTKYQRIVLTGAEGDLRLFLNGHLQFSSRDEHRYHETLVHPACALAGGSPRRVLILGGGDGLALREVLKYGSLEEAVLVDLDPEMTTLFSTREILTRINERSFSDRRARIVNADAQNFLNETSDFYDVIVVDVPDPSNFSVGKLFTREFYRLCKRHLSETGVLVVQATSPTVAPRSYWCIERTIAAAELATEPFHVYVPSFGDWGFVIGTHSPRPRPERLAPGLKLRFLNDSVLPGLFQFGDDQRAPPSASEVNRLNDQVLVHLYTSEWKRSEQ